MREYTCIFTGVRIVFSNKVSGSAVGQLFLANLNMYTIASCDLGTAFGNPC
jgi:hypothetical protein